MVAALPAATPKRTMSSRLAFSARRKVMAPTMLSPAPTVLWLSSVAALPERCRWRPRLTPLRTRRDHHPAHFTGLDQRLSGKAHVIGLAEIALHEGAKLFLVRFHQLNIADVQRGGQRIAGTVNDAAQSLLLRIFTSCIRLSTLIPAVGCR